MKITRAMVEEEIYSQITKVFGYEIEVGGYTSVSGYGSDKDGNFYRNDMRDYFTISMRAKGEDEPVAVHRLTRKFIRKCPDWAEIVQDKLYKKLEKLRKEVIWRDWVDCMIQAEVSQDIYSQEEIEKRMRKRMKKRMKKAKKQVAKPK